MGSQEGRLLVRNTSLTFRKAQSERETRAFIREEKVEVLQEHIRTRTLALPASISIAGLFEGYRVAAQRAITEEDVEVTTMKSVVVKRKEVQTSKANGLKLSKRVRRLPTFLVTDSEQRKEEKIEMNM